MGIAGGSRGPRRLLAYACLSWVRGSVDDRFLAVSNHRLGASLRYETQASLSGISGTGEYTPGGLYARVIHGATQKRVNNTLRYYGVERYASVLTAAIAIIARFNSR